ncbi:MAG: guanylate kinase [Nitrospiraceae bacterium]|nr:guanylate kinase [Nitrospiraceae bacterium]
MGIIKGDLFVISAPSGAGKSTLCKGLMEALPGIRFSVSYTTREPRPGEVNGVHYNFVTQPEFERMVSKGEFLEWARVHDNYYGTSKKAIDEMLAGGADCLLDIDTQGAAQIRKQFPGAVLIFIMPPSMGVLKQRLEGRGSDTPEVIKRRLENAAGEIKRYKEFDYVIINGSLEEALGRLKAVVLARKSLAAKIDPDWIEKDFLNRG